MLRGSLVERRRRPRSETLHSCEMARSAALAAGAFLAFGLLLVDAADWLATFSALVTSAFDAPAGGFPRTAVAATDVKYGFGAVIIEFNHIRVVSTCCQKLLEVQVQMPKCVKNSAKFSNFGCVPRNSEKSRKIPRNFHQNRRVKR